MADREAELFENMRFYGEMRFKQLTLFLAWLSIAGTGVSQSGDEVILGEATLQVVIGFASMFVTGIIWIMEISSTKYWIAHRELLKDKWPSSNRTWRQLSATNITVLFYAICYIFWFYATCLWNSNPIFPWIYGFAFIILIFYTLLNYIPLWKHRPNA